MSSLSVSEPQRLAGVRRLSWLAMARALRGDALAAFPPEAFAQACVIQRFVGRQHILLQSPDAIRHVLVENPQNYTRDPAVLRVLRPMFGGGLFLSAGEEWRRQRRVVAPAFAPRTIHSLTAQVVEAADDFAAALKAESGHQVNLPPRLQQLALEIIGKAIFSLDMPRYGPELRSLILKYANRLARPSLTDYLLPLGLPTLADVARARFRRRWLKLVGQVIADRAARPGSDAPHDLFDVLAAPDPETGASADPESIADQVATIIVAGHETSAMALFWALYLLAQHPEAQQRVAAEVGRTGINAANAAETLPQLVFTRAVIDEVLRLYPPAFVIVRRAVADDIAAGVLIAKGSLVLISPWVLHRHRDFWRAPDRFDPARFLPGAPTPERFAYMPFGAGPRICVGAPFALTELVLVVATLVSAFEIGMATAEPARPVGFVTLQPASPPPTFTLMPRANRGAEAWEVARVRQNMRPRPGAGERKVETDFVNAASADRAR